MGFHLGQVQWCETRKPILKAALKFDDTVVPQFYPFDFFFPTQTLDSPWICCSSRSQLTIYSVTAFQSFFLYCSPPTRLFLREVARDASEARWCKYFHPSLPAYPREMSQSLRPFSGQQLLHDLREVSGTFG